jgi:hypothetical protein
VVLQCTSTSTTMHVDLSRHHPSLEEHQLHRITNTITPPYHYIHLTMPIDSLEDKQAHPAKRLTKPSNDKPLATQTKKKKKKKTSPPSYIKPRKQGPILDHRQVKARISKAKRRAKLRGENVSSHLTTPPLRLLAKYYPPISPGCPPSS